MEDQQAFQKNNIDNIKQGIEMTKSEKNCAIIQKVINRVYFIEMQKAGIDLYACILWLDEK